MRAGSSPGSGGLGLWPQVGLESGARLHAPEGPCYIRQVLLEPGHPIWLRPFDAFGVVPSAFEGRPAGCTVPGPPSGMFPIGQR